MCDKINELNADISELRSLVEQAQRKKVQDLLTIELRRLETALGTLQAEQANAKPADDLKKSKPSAAVPYVVRIKDYAWDQSDKFVKFYVTINGVQTLETDKVTLNCESRKFELTASDLDGKNYVLSIENLLSDINVEKSHHKVKTDMVVVFLKKVHEGNKWSFVTITEKQINDIKAIKNAGDDKPSDSADPTAGLMTMMKKLYEDGDDSMKREIAKAWTQANDKRSSGSDDLMNL